MANADHDRVKAQAALDAWMADAYPQAGPRALYARYSLSTDGMSTRYAHGDEGYFDYPPVTDGRACPVRSAADRHMTINRHRAATIEMSMVSIFMIWSLFPGC